MARLKWVWVALVFAGIAASSCANNGISPNDAGTTDASAIGPCGPGNNAICGGTCVDTNSDFQNCGSCGKVCPSDQVCSHGSCATVCGGGAVRCGNDCVDTTSDVNNCGGCATPCAGGQVCSKGTCSLTCQAGLTNCNGDCVDVTENDDNCGACGSPCAGGQVCSNSKCIATCQSGWTSCAVGDAGATTCVDTQHDPQNCGSCGATCTQGYFCSPVNNIPTCGLACAGGSSLCGSACVDESIDPNHCGGCNTVCSGNTPVCTASHCCAQGKSYCNGACNDLATCIAAASGTIAAGYSHTCAITPLGKLKCWGDDFDGELGDNNSGTQSSTPVLAGTLSSVTRVGAGSSVTCAIANGLAYCWGYGFDGELGDGNVTEEDSPSQLTLTNPIRIDSGGEQGCALLNGGAIKCWGYNFYGEVGDGTTTERNTPVSTKAPAIANAVDISAGLGLHSCAVLSDTNKTVLCWGENDYGECGDGTSNTEDNNPTAVKNLTNVLAISLGNIHTCAIVSGGNIWCWGDDTYGALGDGQTNTTSNVPVQAKNIANALAVAAGGDGFYQHTCAVLQSGAVMCWGSNSFGQLGDGTGNDSTTPVMALASGAIAIAAGATHTCALKGDGTAWCWGYNGDGELGDGTTNDSKVPVKVSGF